MVKRITSRFLTALLTGVFVFSTSFILVSCSQDGSEENLVKGGEQDSESEAKSPTPSPSSHPAPPPEAGEILSFQGTGGAVQIGDTLEMAKKAMPPQKGARETGPTSFLVFGTDGWAWFTADNTTGFEVMLRGGKVDGMAHTDSGKSVETYQRRVEEVIRRLGEPTRQARGKWSAVWVWQKGDYARVEVVAEMSPSHSYYLCFIGRESDLKVLNYRPDDPQTMVVQMDLSAELARKELNNSPRATKGR